MSRRRSGSELDALHAQAAALHEKIRTVAAKNKARQLADDKRRCELAGEVALAHMAAHPQDQFALTLQRLLDARARSRSDRALFGLKELALEASTMVVGDAGPSA